MEQEQRFGILILAAGNSSRLGKPKQLLPYKGKTLIRHVVDSALEAQVSHVIVVTGANAESISDELSPTPAKIIRNENWQEGMSSSIRIGISVLQNTSSPQGVILAVSDQPFVDSTLFLALIQKARSSGKGIVASAYDGTLGTPALFNNQYFSALLDLKGAEGAKKLIKKFSEDVDTVPFALGGIDIDTQEDYRKLTDLNNPSPGLL